MAWSDLPNAVQESPIALTGRRVMNLHAALRATADRTFMEQDGTSASVALADGRRSIAPLSRADIRPRPE